MSERISRAIAREASSLDDPSQPLVVRATKLRDQLDRFANELDREFFGRESARASLAMRQMERIRAALVAAASISDRP